MNLLRLSPHLSDKSGIADYSNVFDKILRQEKVRIIKAKYLFTSRSTWWLPLDFLFRCKYWEGLLDGIDAVHAEIGMHQAKEILTLYYLKKKRKNLKIFMTVHDPGIDSYRVFKVHYNTSGSFFSKVVNKIADKIEPVIDELFFNRVFDYIVENSSLIFVFDKWGMEQLCERYPGLNINIINHPIFDFPKKKTQPIDDRKLVFAGFWSENKGIETLIQAYHLLVKKQRIGIPRLMITGGTQVPNSSYNLRIKKMIRNLGLLDYVDLPGFLEEDRMFEILSKAILVIPYTDKILGSASGIYIRGLQAGAVTIVSDNRTLSSFATNNSISLVFKQESVEDLSDKVSRVLQDSKLAYCLVKSGQDFVYQYGNWKKLGRSIIKAYAFCD